MIKHSPLKIADHLLDLGKPKFIGRDFLLQDPATVQKVDDLLINTLGDLRLFYPDFSSWISNIVIPGIITGERSVILEYRNDDLAGLAILKDSDIEKKLCCLQVMPKFQGSGIGLTLFEKSFDLLNTKNPLLSVSEEQRSNFLRIFKYYGFEFGETYYQHYRPLKNEISFNGLLK
ncbi:GNAT family N-acetyltransferase [Erwinia sp. B116]|uniref:GNAT family N-acetyltransferase n=1 Tax=Erwinia sp. B116 TaxID=1561024 RepID=UPI0011AF00CC|nr:GNAT family N-acetyltransferase [Erwinia sp. B116]